MLQHNKMKDAAVQVVLGTALCRKTMKLLVEIMKQAAKIQLDDLLTHNVVIVGIMNEILLIHLDSRVIQARICLHHGHQIHLRKLLDINTLHQTVQTNSNKKDNRVAERIILCDAAYVSL